MTRPPRPERQTQIAFSLARYGFHVFPVSAKKVPLVKGWQTAATRDAEQIATWWTIDYPGALVGYAAGLSDVVIVDLDADKGEGAGRDNLAAGGHDLPATPVTYSTPSGGEHRVYAAPEGRELTVAQARPVAGVDIRAGNGFAIYYGRPLREQPALPVAPDWALIDKADTKALAAPDAEVDQWLKRAPGGKPSKALKKAARRIAEHDTDHATMLEVIGDLVSAGTRGEAGAGKLLEQARDRYTRHYPEHAHHFDAAALGSVRFHGLPPATIALSKPERKAIERRVSPPGDVVKAPRYDDGDLIAGELTDADLAEQVAEEIRDTFAVVRGVGVMRYDGIVWRESDEAALVETTRRILRRVRADETRAAIMRADKRREQEAKALEQRTRIVAVARLAAGILAEQNVKLDAHPDLLNTPSGVVDLRTKTLQPHDPALYLSKVTAAPYDPNADQTTWRRALEAVPPKVAAWLQVRFGQAATGYMTSDDVLPVLMGSGHNGKTTMLDATRGALGDYAVTVPKRLLLSSPGDHPTELTSLMGARLAVLEELPEGRNLNVERLKDVLGTPVLTARRMRQDNVSWRATHSLVLSTNYLPVVAETDHGTWRRLALVIFPYRFVTASDLKRSTSSADRLRDDSIRAALSSPDAGVLAWLVDGAHAWYKASRTLPRAPKAVRRDTEAWRNDADPVMGYVTERLETGVDGSAVTCADLAADFNQWLEARGHKAWSLQTINARFAGHESMRDAPRKKINFGKKTLPSRPASAFRPLPPVTMAWQGLRYRDEQPGVPMSADVLSRALASPG